MSIKERLHQTQQLIQDTANQCDRNPHDIQLIGVTKGQPVSALIEAYDAGLTEFAENYWQEAQYKIAQLSHLPITWHFIGPLQSNKTPAIANHVAWVHSISREKIARLLASHRTPSLPPLNVCIQVNLDGEESKSGLAPEQVYNLVQQIHSLPNLKLKGLMTIPKLHANAGEQYTSFAKLRRLREELNHDLDEKLETLSMGMSNDFVAAIRAGSTMVRIGQAIFGER